MPITLLLDLDDTLLDTDTRAFLPAYYESLARHLESPGRRPLPCSKPCIPAWSSCGRIPIRLARCSEVFEAHFYPKTWSSAGGAPGPRLPTFYSTVFPGLGRMARPIAGGRELVDWALAAGHEVVIATDPLFPLEATEERVRWAGLDPARFSLISAFETFHFSKSHVAYFAELLGRLGWPDRPILMVGNDLERDLIPARALGLPTFRVDGSTALRRGRHRADLCVRRLPPAVGGDLMELMDWLNSSPLETYVPSFKTREAILAVLRATPAVLQSMTANLTPANVEARALCRLSGR